MKDDASILASDDDRTTYEEFRLVWGECKEVQAKVLALSMSMDKDSEWNYGDEHQRS